MYLDLDHGHKMYYEVHGSAAGPTAVVLHGGPGGALSRRTLRFFNLRKWRVILYDQRGCGRSTPFGVASLAHNKTADLLRDMELLRTTLDAEKWYITGGSWGSTLGMLYAETYPHRVLGMCLRAVCLMDRAESEWLYMRDGAAQVFPDAYEKFLSVLTPAERRGNMDTILGAYHNLLCSSDKKVQNRAAAAWSGYEDSVISLIPKTPKYNGTTDLSVAILENHYFKNNAWLKPGQIVKNAHKMRNIPIYVIHGRYDMICPYRSVQTLMAILPKMREIRVDDGGHSGYFEKEVGYIRDITDAAAKNPSKRNTRKNKKE